MSGRRLVGLATVIATGLMSIAAASSLAAPPPQTISLLEIDTAYAGTGGYSITSNGPPTAGQGITFSGTTYKWAGKKKGAPIGHIQVLCTVTTANEALCNGVISLPTGILELLGPTSLGNGPSEIAVVGGTGAFAGAGGWMSTHPIGPQDGSTSASANVIHITN